MAEWTRRSFGKGEIDRAGELLVPWWSDYPKTLLDPESLGRAYSIVQNWRSSHAFPLNTFQVSLRSRARRVQRDALVAQRLKRFSSVMDKLAREPHMKLSQMQDLGGCRAIVADVHIVEELVDLYRGTESMFFDAEGALKCYDYIKSPKPDGYRGVHVVGRYVPSSDKQEAWRGQRIEIQLRSRLQHAFATAVETVTTFTRERLKFGGGPTEWRRFFSLMGSAIALREGTARVPGTPTDDSELVRELGKAARDLRIRQRLRGWSTALTVVRRRSIGKFRWLLLVLDMKANTIKVTGYADRQKAASELAEIEKQPGDFDAVLVWVRSIKDLKAAYPNYYADTGEFLDALNRAVKG